MKIVAQVIRPALFVDSVSSLANSGPTLPAMMAWVSREDLMQRDDVWLGGAGTALMMVVLWLIIRDASRSPPRDHRG